MDAPARSVSEWLEEVLAAERRGELLAAFDLAERGLDEHEGDRALQHRGVLALARAGSTEQAARRFREYRLAETDGEDARALGARIAKDEALAAEGAERRRLALRSAKLYEAVFAETGGYYPGINAATLLLVAGDRNGARRLARRVLELLPGSVDGYYRFATEAEARLLLGELPAARSALERAASLDAGDHAAVATTRRQLRLVGDELGIDGDVLDALPAPGVVHYAGHRIDADGPFAPELEERVAEAIATEVEQASPAYAYGSLASGADILFAEALLARGAEVHLVLPFSVDEFVQASVADAGPGWVRRFERCCAAAVDVRYATDGAYLGDDVLFRYAAELAMGLALLHSRFLDGSARQLAVWDGGPPRGAAGTAVDVAAWARGGRETTVIRPGHGPARGAAPEPGETESRRVVRALLFADVKGFSQLGDEQLPAFADRVLGAFADVLRAYEASVGYRNTWGDGLYVVLEDVEAAAACALELQRAMIEVELEAHGLPTSLALRLGGHVGPVLPVHDPILGVDAFMGFHVSRTARIEPVTPPGDVYVTEPFAAALELAGSAYTCDYVGHMPAAKDYGRLRMYRLRAPALRRSGRPAG
jgi:hypothetical protein